MTVHGKLLNFLVMDLCVGIHCSSGLIQLTGKQSSEGRVSQTSLTLVRLQGEDFLIKKNPWETRF